MGDIKSASDQYRYDKDDLKRAFEALDKETQGVLTRTAERIIAFASAQRASINEQTTGIAGGEAGQFVTPVVSAGCYAPGGRYPLPSRLAASHCVALSFHPLNFMWLVSCPLHARSTLNDTQFTCF